MAENTAIEWATHTFNPWLGCTKIAPPCDHCYAESWAKRAGHPELWNGERRRTTPENWRKPLKWDEAARTAGVRARVFCASLADVFDNVVPEQWREDLFRLILRTPNLDWMLLTKRIGNAKNMLPADWGYGYPNAWLGATFGDQSELARDIVKLLGTPAQLHFCSHEPGLGPLDLERIEQGDIEWKDGRTGKLVLNALTGSKSLRLAPLQLVITGGESGGGARPYNIQWAREIVGQCRRHGRAAFVKQLGARPYLKAVSSFKHAATGVRLSITEASIDTTFKLRDRKGGDMAEWPADLRVRELPGVTP